jgi:hypothetical protein
MQKENSFFRVICGFLLRHCKIIPLLLMFYLMKESPEDYFTIFMECIAKEIVRCDENAFYLKNIIQVFGNMKYNEMF